MSPFNRIALVGNALASAVSLLNVEGFCAVDTIHKMISQVFLCSAASAVNFAFDFISG